MSEKGTWVVTLRVSENANNKINITNTVTNKNIVLDNLTNIEFLTENSIVAKLKSQFILLDLQTEKQVIIPHVSEFKILNNIICLRDTSGTLALVEVNKGKLNQLLKIDNVVYHSISQDSKKLMFVTLKDSYSVFQLNITDLTTIEVEKLPSMIENIKWSNDGNYTYIKTVDSKLFLLDLNKNKLQEITLRHTNAEYRDIIFMPDNKIFISYVKKRPKTESFIDYVEIWNTKDNNLEFKRNNTIINPEDAEWCVYDIKNKNLNYLNKSHSGFFYNIANSNTLMAVDQIKYKDYTHFTPDISIELFNIQDQSKKFVIERLSNSSNNLSYSPEGTYISYKINNRWNFLNTKSLKTIAINNLEDQQTLVWDNNNQENAYITAKSNIYKISLINGKVSRLTNFSDDIDIQILNIHKEYTNLTSLKYISNKDSLLIKTINKENNYNGLYILHSGKLKVLVEPSSNRIDNVLWNTDYTSVSYTEENYNLPPTLKIFNQGTTRILQESNIPTNLYNWRKQKIINYKNKFNRPLKGVLYYPKNYIEGKKYPMITHIYQIQSDKSNFFEMPNIKSSFNFPLYIENDYFVFFPDTYISDEGPGISALDCINSAISSVLEKEEAINKDKLGIIGNSFGGYETNFIVTQTNLFKAAVSGVAVSSLIWDYFSYSYNYSKPLYWQYENGQLDMRKSFSEDPDKYLNNSPILYAHQVQTPLLSWTGLEDYNVHWEQTRHFFTALKRYDKKHIALFYKGEGHAITDPKKAKDLFLRIKNWFDYYLKGDNSALWITKSENAFTSQTY
ncbi:alpha/beta hydrolase family protein [Myroides indicus]|nr:prolyl oligopeptidase family serine peptidase [Myroides indicus]